MTSHVSLITPPSKDSEQYPYARIWRKYLFESGVLALIVISLYVVISILHLSVPTQMVGGTGIVLAFVPCGVWFVSSSFAERRSLEPRRGLFLVAFMTMLVANSIGTPILDQFFRPSTWLSLSPATTRIIGYTLTTGMLQQLIKYLTVYYIIWPHHLRTREDGVAYGIASGIGYATVLNIQFLTLNPLSPIDTLAFHIFANYALHTTTGIVVGYGVGETLFSNPTLVFLPFILVIAAVVSGIAIPIHAGLVNTSISISTISATKPLLGFGFSLMLMVIVTTITAGLIQNSERYEREAKTRI